MVRKNAIAVMLAVLLAGCTAMRQDKYCKWALPVWGAGRPNPAVGTSALRAQLLCQRAKEG